MNEVKKAIDNSITAITITNLLDIISTAHALKIGLREANPLMIKAMEKLGPETGLITLKILEIISMIALFYGIKEAGKKLGLSEEETAKIITITGATNALINLIIVINNIMQIMKH